MFSWRARRQITVIVIFAAAIVVILFRFGIKFIPSPTCFDDRKNQGELEADCGGPCASCELKNPKPISIFWARLVQVRPNFYDAAAEIENANEVLSSVSVEYSFTLFEGLVPVAVKKGRTFIFPRERAHVIETSLETSREPTRVEFKITNIEWQFKEIRLPFLAVEAREYHIEKDKVREQGVIEARIVNRSNFDFREVDVKFVALDQAGNLLGANHVVLENLISGSPRLVKSIWPEPLKGNVAKIEVEPRVNIFDPASIIKP